MADAPSTRASLLVRIRDTDDQQAWSQFVELYAPLIYGFARKHGLQDADAADVTQEVLRTVAAAAKALDYDPQRGSFRGWLFTVCRTRLINFVNSRQRVAAGTGDTALHQDLEQLPSNDAGLSSLWEQDYERRLFAWAAEQVQREVQTTTWQAFWRTAVDAREPQQVAKELGLTVAAVYLAKSRVMTRLKDRIRRVHAE
jgi:RNA polymerase sigma-70 factor (ECF subfamily)